jgi:hypothetical protein
VAVFFFDLAVHPSGKQGIIVLSRCFHKFPVNLGQDTATDKTTLVPRMKFLLVGLPTRAPQHALKPLLSGLA